MFNKREDDCHKKTLKPEDVLFPSRSYIQRSLKKKGNFFIDKERKSIQKPKGKFYIDKTLPHKGIPRCLKSFRVVDHIESMYDDFEDPNVVNSFYDFLFAANDDTLNDVSSEDMRGELHIEDEGENRQGDSDMQSVGAATDKFKNQVLDYLTEAVLEVELYDDSVVIDDFEYDEICEAVPNTRDERDVDEFDFTLQDVLLDLVDIDEPTDDVESHWENLIDVAFNLGGKTDKNLFNASVEEGDKHRFGEKFYFGGPPVDIDNFEEYGIEYLTRKTFFEEDVDMKRRMSDILCGHEDCPPPCYLFLSNDDRQFLHRYTHPPPATPRCPVTDIIQRINKTMSFNLRRKEITQLPKVPREIKMIDYYEENKRLLKYKVTVPDREIQKSQMTEEEKLKHELVNRLWI